MRRRTRSILPLLALALAVPTTSEAQVADTLYVEGFEAVANVVRRNCPDSVMRGPVGSSFTCTYVALDADGTPTQARFRWSSDGNPGPFEVQLEEFGDSAVANVSITGPGRGALVVEVLDPETTISFLLVYPHPDRLPAGTVPGYYWSDTEGQIEAPALAEPALFCLYRTVGSRREVKNDPFCPGDLPLFSETETDLTVEYSCLTDAGAPCAADSTYWHVGEFDFGDASSVQDVTTTATRDTGLREARLEIEGFTLPYGLAATP